MRSPLRRLLAAGLVLGLAVPFTCGSIREDEFLCHEAIAHLKQCCPNASVPSDFCSITGTCSSPGHDVLLTPQQSHCILDKDCSAVAALCTKLSLASDAGGVCP